MKKMGRRLTTSVADLVAVRVAPPEGSVKSAAVDAGSTGRSEYAGCKVVLICSGVGA